VSPAEQSLIQSAWISAALVWTLLGSFPGKSPLSSPLTKRKTSIALSFIAGLPGYANRSSFGIFGHY
jgi:hypothetical protein